jgi:hypothetical protein
MGQLMLGIAGWLATAAAAANALPAYTVPRPVEATKNWIKPEDYPIHALRARERGYVPIRLTISPTGEPMDCNHSTQSLILGRVACRLLLQRARFEPASDAGGRKYYGVFESIVAFGVAGHSMPERPGKADMILTVDTLPAESPDPVMVPIAFLVDTEGNIQDCSPSFGHSSTDPLGPIACHQARRTAHPTVVRDNKKQPVSSVQGLWVLFQTPKAQAATK